MRTEIVQITVRAPRFTRCVQQQRGTRYRDAVRTAFAAEGLCPPVEKKSYLLEGGKTVSPDALVLTRTNVTVVSRAVNG